MLTEANSKPHDIMIYTDGSVTRDLSVSGFMVEQDNNNNRIQRRYSRLFYNLLTAPRAASNTYTQVARAQSCANHMQHIERLSRASVMLRATWYEGTAQLLSLTELKSHLFELYFIG